MWHNSQQLPKVKTAVWYIQINIPDGKHRPLIFFQAYPPVYLFSNTPSFLLSDFHFLLSTFSAIAVHATSDYMNGIKLKAFGQLDDISNIIQAYEKTGTQQSIREYEKTKYPQRRERLVKKKKADVINDLRTEMFLDAENTLKEHINDHIFYLEEPTGAGKSNTALNLSFQIIKKVKNINKIFCLSQMLLSPLINNVSQSISVSVNIP